MRAFGNHINTLLVVVNRLPSKSKCVFCSIVSVFHRQCVESASVFKEWLVCSTMAQIDLIQIKKAAKTNQNHEKVSIKIMCK